MKTLRVFVAGILLSSVGLAETDKEKQLEGRVHELEQRLAALEAKISEISASASQPAGASSPKSDAAPQTVPSTTNTTAADLSNSEKPETSQGSSGSPGDGLPALPGGFTANVFFDGNYNWNFSRPYNRVNLLRAYDVLSNNFNINQAGLVLERPVSAETGNRFGVRLDLMYGQATETLQGGAQNESRPQVYRPIFQAYGTYLAPIGKGLTIDFGKFASALGYEGNYTKDQFTYSRSYFFNFLPFYHMGFRTSYTFSDKVALSYWLVNGAQQTEDFNGFKSNAFILNVKPSKKVSWNLNYYFGQEGRGLLPNYNPELPQIASQPGLPLTPASPLPDGRMHIVDSYASWQITDRLTVVGEADYVLNRALRLSPPSRVIGGAAYVAYKINNNWTIATRAEYFDDRSGLFSGVSQALKENTVALTWQPRDGFQLRSEFRRDYSNRPFFFTSDPGRLDNSQTTATLGLLWWFGGKPGAW